MANNKSALVQEKTTEGRTAMAQTKPRPQWKTFLLALLVLAACFSVPLYRLARFAWGNELYSYILLVPFICWYLARSKKPELVAESRPWRGFGLALLATGMGTLAVDLWFQFSGVTLATEDGLALVFLAFFLLLSGVAFTFLGRETIRTIAFPMGMMFFIVPMPSFLVNGLVTCLQYGSADAASGFFKLSGLPTLRNDLVFFLPGLPNGIMIAPECSGIHSSLILFITSLLAGYLFLRSPWKRAILALTVIPLGLLRNGFRVFTLGELCVHYGPQMLDTPIHHKGGPLFFALSLIPFFALLAFLYRGERRALKEVKD